MRSHDVNNKSAVIEIIQFILELSHLFRIESHRKPETQSKQ
jgi:hypothetical protein